VCSKCNTHKGPLNDKKPFHYSYFQLVFRAQQIFQVCSKSRLPSGLKLVPTLPTGGIAEVIRSSIVGDIFRNLLPRDFALRRIRTMCQLANSLFEEPNLDTYQQRPTLLECRNLHRYQSILASLLEQPCALSKCGIGHGVSTPLRQNSPAGGCPCMTCQRASI
jgi:hypothetical protein